tara:strand:- start:404 stop:1768 length:1365 start_codon:yes stop_codon:yes gene_type:complete
MSTFSRLEDKHNPVDVVDDRIQSMINLWAKNSPYANKFYLRVFSEHMLGAYVIPQNKRRRIAKDQHILVALMQSLVPKFFTDYNQLANASKKKILSENSHFKMASQRSKNINRNIVRSFALFLDRKLKENAASESQKALLRELNKQIEATPLDISLLKKRAAILSKLKNYKEAADDLRQVLKINPSLTDDVQPIIDELDELVKKATMTPEQQAKESAQQAKELKLQISLRKIEENYKKSGSIPSRKWRYHKNTALAFLAAGKRNEALDEINQAIKLKPDEASLYKTRSVIFSALGKDKESRKDNEYAAWLSALVDGNNQYFLNFRVLPEGFWYKSDALTSLLKLFPKMNRDHAQDAITRMRVIGRLGHIRSWVGGPRKSSDVYFIYEFEDCVVAECPTYGNAIYALRPKGNWQQLFSLTKAQLQSRGATVIHHKGDWQIRLRDFIRNRYHRYRY